MEVNNKYTKMQKEYYNSTADIMAVENHRGHDFNPDYYNLLLKEVYNNPNIWNNKRCLDFGCGIGRNVDNLLKLSKWERADGCDLSSENIYRADCFLKSCNHNNYKLFVTDGISLNSLESDFYDFIMSTIVLQHIAVYDIRFKILSDIYRVMKNEGLFSFQMAIYNENKIKCANYYNNSWDASGTNGAFDVSVSDPNYLINDLKKIGYKNITYEIKPEWDANSKRYMDSNISNSKWIFIKAYK
jgi:ubiquinone/menaquinone biosynthesis C-methylase UbiE